MTGAPTPDKPPRRVDEVVNDLVVLLGRLAADEDDATERNARTAQPRPSDPHTATPSPGRPIAEQRRYQITATSADGEYRAGDTLFTEPFDQHRSAPLPDDDVVIRWRRSGVVHYGLRRAITTKDGTELAPILDGREQEADGEIIGLVIGRFRPRHVKVAPQPAP